MATYIQGLTDYVPQIQPFKPDLNFYDKVLKTKQDAYDKAQSKLSNVYGTLLYSPLSRQDNITRRDDFFKMIEQDIKKVSAMDLSLPQNQSTALSVFDPLIEDDDIIHDMNFTKTVSNEMERGNSYRLCTDPEKCGGSYWDEGIMALQYRLADYAKASRGDALSMAAPRYTPKIDVAEKALKWAKDMDLVVEEVTNNGQYIVKKQNGEKLMMPLLSMYMAKYGQDQAVKDMYRTTAYLNRKGYIEENKGKYGGDEDKAEDAYFNEVMNSTIKNLQKDATDHKDAAGKARTRTQVIKNKIKRDGISINDPLFDDFRNGVEDEKTATEISTYYEGLDNNIKNLPNVAKDRKAMRNAIENFVADGFMKEDLTKTAYTFAITHNAVTDMDANPYALKAYESSLNIQEKMVQFDLDVQKAIKLAEIDIGKEMAKNMMNGGFPTDYEGTPEAPGAGNSTAAGAVDMLKTSQGESLKAGQAMYKKQNEYINNTVTYLMNEVNNPNGDAASKQHAKNELKSMLGGYYDEKSNQITSVDGKFKTTDITQLPVTTKVTAQLYKNAKALNENNKNLYKNLYARNASISEQYDQFNQLRSGYSKIIQDNNGLIKSYGKASTDVKNKFYFDLLFEKTSDGQYNVITSEDEYVNKILPRMQGGSKDKNEKYLREAYKENMGIYRELYSSGKVPGIKSPYGMGLGGNPDGGVTAMPVSWNVDYVQPSKFGNQALISFYKNAMMAGDGSYKILNGSGHTDKEFAGAETSSAYGKTLMNNFVSDLRSGRFQSKDQQFKAPSAKITYADVAANSGNKVSVTLSNINPEWLKSHATGKEGQKTVFGKKLEEAITEGVTMYLDKSAADNMLTNQYKMKAGDVYLNSGLSYNISRPNAGKVTLRKMANNVVAEGVMYGYDSQGNKQSVNITSTFDPTLSGDALIKNYTRLFDQQEQMNIDYMQSGALPMIKDEAALIRHIQDANQGMSPGAQSISDKLNYFRSTLGM